MRLGPNSGDSALVGVGGSCSAGATRPSAELPLLLLVAALALAIRARHRH